jgi:uncharacterized protein (DUF4415 family)
MLPAKYRKRIFSLSLEMTYSGLQAIKVSTTVRFDSDVLEAFRATGRGWQGRMNQALKEWLKEQAAS